MTALRYQDGRLKVEGDLTCERVSEISSELLVLAGREGNMAIDLGAVGRCDSTCVALLNACKEIKLRQQDELLLVNVPPNLATLFRVYAVDGVFV